MAKLIYFMLMSLDGFIAGENDDLDWSAPSEEVMAFINDLQRPIGTYLNGRKEYETMMVWETPDLIPGLTPADNEFAQIWHSAEKIVYSKTLEAVSTSRTRLERKFDPQIVLDLKAKLPHDISIAGPNLAAQAIRSGLVDEFQLFVIPALLGHGKRILPDNVTINLDLLEERRFEDGWVFLRYRMHS
jgi:dihydrofolate reductase